MNTSCDEVPTLQLSLHVYRKYKSSLPLKLPTSRVSTSHNNSSWLNTLRPRENGRHFPCNILKCIYLNEKLWISIEISLKFVPNGPINTIPVLVQKMAWHRPSNKPLSETILASLLMHICITRPQWIDDMWHHRIWSTLVQVMACCLVAPSHCLNQCWLIISEVLWHSAMSFFTGNAQDIFSWKITNLRLQSHLPAANKLMWAVKKIDVLCNNPRMQTMCNSY